MHKKTTVIFCAVCVFLANSSVWGQADKSDSAGLVELIKYEKDFSSARVEPSRLGDKAGVAVVFEGTDGLHYYAKKETAPSGFRLKIGAKSESFEFGEAVFPKPKIFFDATQGKKVEVYAGNFAVFLPIKDPVAASVVDSGDIEVTISAITCTDIICLLPFEKVLHKTINYGQRDSFEQITLASGTDKQAAVKQSGHSVWFALALAFLAGLSLNIMPCIWPILPIIVMKIVEHARESKGKSAAMGLAFCLGVLLFFACLAGANIILQIFYGTVLQWGDQFRNPAVVAGMALLLVVLALFMFGLFAIGLPSSVTGKTGSGKGYSGTVAMGFLAAVLSTPCSFAILAAAFAWAQAQRLGLATLTIMVIGVGMALPYAILTSMPGLLKRLPKAGKWMELFKQAIGFLLLGIAIWLIGALPQERKAGVLYFALVLSFCVWMWGGWVSFSTAARRKWLIRGIAVVLTVAAGFTFLPGPVDNIDWQGYDSAIIEQNLQAGKPVLIKFTAEWCVSCKVVEKVVFGRDDIASLIEEKNVLAVKADTTVQSNPATLALKNIYNEPGVPVSILFLPGRSEPLRWRGKAFGDELKELLEKLESE